MNMPGNQRELLEKELQGLEVGEHLCSVYENQKEQFLTAVPFVLAGLARNEKCIYIIDENTKAQVIAALAGLNNNIAKYLEAGQLEFLTKEGTYLKDGYFDPERMIETLRQLQAQALKDGYSVIRITGEMTWVFSKFPGVEKLIEYEAKLNCFIPQSRCLLLCQYNQSKFSPEVMFDVIRVHPKIMLEGKLCENHYFILPDDFFEILKGKINLKFYEKVKQDILDREKIRSKEELQKTEDRFKAIFDASTDGMILADVETRKFSMCNSEFFRKLGYTEDELMSLRVEDIHPKDDLPVAMEQFKKVVKGEIKLAQRVAVKRKDGSIFYADISMALVTLDGRNYLLGNFRDITERKKMEDELKEKISDLEQFSKFTVDRELKMEELEGQIKNLKRKLQNRA